MVWSVFRFQPSLNFTRSKPNSNSIALQRCLPLFNSRSSLKQLRQIHAPITVSGLHRNPDFTQFYTSGSIGIIYPIKFINHGYCTVKFSEKFESCSWNGVLKVYAISNSGSQREAVRFFLSMRRLGVKPDKYTYPFLFKACSSFAGLNEGRQIHGDAVKHGYLSNVYVQNTLIQFYGSCKKLIDSYKLFDEMTYRTLVSWNSMLSAHIECSWFYESVEFFIKMRNSRCKSDETTMVIVLSACAELGNLSLGKWVHSQVIGNGMFVNCQLGTALVDMYGKCGDVNYASSVFNRMVNRNVWTWSSMILGFSQHGFAQNALELFREMKNHSIKPNHVTFLAVLCACSHAGLVEEGQHYFNEMEQVYRVKPMMVHYGAMVDILDRAGCLKEAYDFVMNMPIEADGVVRRALLSSCIIHDVNDYTGVGQNVRRRLIELEPKRSGNLVMLANNYAEVGLWEKAEHLRSKMRDKGLKKIAGESCLEIAGTTFRFLSGDYSSVGSADIFMLLKTLSLHTEMIKFE